MTDFGQKKVEFKVFKGNQQRPLKSVFETCTKTKQYTTVQTGWMQYHQHYNGVILSVTILPYTVISAPQSMGFNSLKV